MTGLLQIFARCSLAALIAGMSVSVLADPQQVRGERGSDGRGMSADRGGPPGRGGSDWRGGGSGQRGGPPDRGRPDWSSGQPGRGGSDWRGRPPGPGGPGWSNQRYWGPRYGVPTRYPRPGYVVRTLPQHRVVVWGGVNYFWAGGVWYRPYGVGFTVVAPPIGIVVPVLPPAYAVMPFGQSTFFVANDVFYTANPAGPGYVVVAPPEGAMMTQQQGVPSTLGQPFIYPRAGQSVEQQDRDHFECHEWAVGQSGFDPTRPQSGSPGEVDAHRSEYGRAMSACMDGRGYTVR